MSAVLMFLSAGPALAQYGSGTAENLQCVTNDLKVRATTQSKYYDNLDANTYLFKSGDLVEYSINIENSKDVVVSDTKVAFSLPTCSTLVYGPNQKEANNGNLNWIVPEIKAKETKSFTVRARINDTCTIKKLVAISSATCQNGSVSRDNAVVYIGKMKVPDTGAADMLVKTIAVAMVAGVGVAARKLARGY